MLAVVKTPDVVWSTVWLADVILLCRRFEAAAFSVVFACQDLVETEHGLLVAVLNAAIRGELLQGYEGAGIAPQLEPSFRLALSFSNVFRYASLNIRLWLESAFHLSLKSAPNQNPARFVFAVVVIATIDNSTLQEVTIPLYVTLYLR